MTKPFTSAWTYIKRGFIFELIGLGLSLFTTMFLVGLMTQDIAVFLIGMILLVPLLLGLVGYIATFVVRKVN